MNLYDYSGYLGAVLMAIFAFTLVIPVAICGLVLLTVQSVNARMHNLTILNLISIGGFAANLGA
jgi:hypothetical protein|tara:strand:- start:573 stop:764 length:192 start_codon:yes stop_codon:yes gene_type:complete